MFELYKKIGKMAEGSYGLIYLYDDEDEGKENEFQVRGIIFKSVSANTLASTIERNMMELVNNSNFAHRF